MHPLLSCSLPLRAIPRLNVFLLLFFISAVSYAQTGGERKIGNVADLYQRLSSLKTRGGKITLSLGDTSLTVTVNVNRIENGELVIIGGISGSTASNLYFNIGLQTGALQGKAVMFREKRVFNFYSNSQGEVFAAPEDINEVVCVEYDQAQEDSLPMAAPAPGSAAYKLQSLPGATAVALLDFDGQYVSNTKWNSGNPIRAAASSFSESQVTEIWRMISEDYRPFNVNITTDSTVFFAAPANRRIRCIFTPTNTAAPGSGGIAYVGSFSNGNDNDVPCWVFNSGVKSGGEAGSHEIGHTFGLHHDGRTSPAEDYFTGQGIWAPIMGAGYYKILAQWSKGEYPNANNQEDDIAIITRTTNGITFRADEAGNTNATAKALTIGTNGAVAEADNYGIITQHTDVDVYSFTTSGGQVSLTVKPSSVHPDLNVLLTLTDASGTVITTADPNGTNTASFAASITTTLDPGKYYLQVDGTGQGDLTTGFSDYASIGEYTISGAIPVAPSNDPPVVTITAPASNTAYTTVPATITFTASASDPDGTISKVEFYSGTVLLGSDNTAPYSINWTNVAAGTYTVTAKAIDNSGNQTTSAAVTVTVNAPPAISITSPSDFSVFLAPANFMLVASATDLDGRISKVEFYNGSTLLGSDITAPYTFGWANVAAGTYMVTAKATDNSGNQTTSATILITVNAPPAISITSPSVNSVFVAPANITLNASATDQDGRIRKVEFYDGTILLGSDNIAPFSFSWTNVNAGTYNVTAMATDERGATATSQVVTIIVDSPPAVSITSPLSNSTFVAPANVLIQAAASDADGTVSKVEFYNGNTLLGMSSSSPYSFEWKNLGTGTYTITAIATDDLGISTTSAATVITVNSNKPSAINITSPAGNSVYTAPGPVTIGVTATDPDGSITKVEYYNGNTLIGTSTGSPGTYVWNNVSPGTYTITVKVTDSNGGITTSAPVTITVEPANELPTVRITAPPANSTFVAAAGIQLEATAIDPDGYITAVSFYSGNTLLGTDNTVPFTCSWTNVPAGTYTVTAKATDNKGASSTSAPKIIQVIPNQLPGVAITAPSTNTISAIPADILISADATDSDGSIVKVDFYQGNVLLGTDEAYPYSYQWQNPPSGHYTITAVATDDKGGTATSSSVTVIVDARPEIVLTSPAASDLFTAPASITLTASASDPDGAVARVDFYLGTTLLASLTSAPYTFQADNIPGGTYEVTAVVTDDQGITSVSSPVTIVVADQTISGIRPSNASSLLLVSPNPFQTQTVVSLRNGEQIREARLFDVHGQEIGNVKEHTGEITIGENLTTGVYLLLIVTDKQTYIKNIIKTR